MRPAALTKYPVVVENLLNLHAHCLDVQIYLEGVYVQVLLSGPLPQALGALNCSQDVAWKQRAVLEMSACRLGTGTLVLYVTAFCVRSDEAERQ